MKSIYTLFGISLVAASIMLVASHVTLKNIDQLGAAQPSVEQLLAQLKSLQAQLAAKQAQVTTTYQFTRVLKVGDRGEDVRQLQILLNKDTLTQIAVSGDGSPGKETTYFGLGTSRAVAKFQEKYKSEILTPNQLTKGTGTVGNATIKKLNALVAVTKTAGTPGNIAVTTQNPNVVNNLPTQTSNPSTTTQTTTSTSSSLLPPTNCGAPVITSASSASGIVGSAFSYTISITSIAAPTFSASGLPAGLTLSGSRISGTPTTAGTYTTTITATSNCGTGTKVLTITIANQQTQVTGTIITPGSGFSGATAQPATIGTGFASDAKAIAKWDVVPQQTFTGNFNVGVVAFHINDIDRVAFSANGGPWTNIYSMTQNAQTSVNEYWATLRASDFKDGQIEVRAIAYPKVGIPRVLESLYLYANPSNTASVTFYASQSGSNTTGDGSITNPFGKNLDKALQTIPDGGTIILKDAGVYDVNLTQAWVSGNSRQNKQWITIKGADNLSNQQVFVTSSSGQGLIPRLHWARWQNVGFDFSTFGQYLPSGAAGSDNVWFDHVYMTYNGWQNTSFNAPIAYSPGALSYITDSYAYNGVYGTVAGFVRNVVNEKISGAPILAPDLAINVTIKNFNSDWTKELPTVPSNPYHRDIWHSWWGSQNVIAYGLTATEDIEANPIRLEGSSPLVSKDLAFINWNVATRPDNEGGDPNFGQPYIAIGMTLDNLLVRNYIAPNNRWSFYDSTPLSAHNFVIQKSGFHWATFDAWIFNPQSIESGVYVINQGNYKASTQSGAPKNLSVQATTQGNQLTWQAGTNASASAIRRSDDNGASWKYVTNCVGGDGGNGGSGQWCVGGTATSYTDATIQQNQTSLYAVETVNWSNGAHTNSNIASVTNTVFTGATQNQVTQTNQTTQTTSTNNPVVTSTGLVGLWTMDSADISGSTIQDRTGNGHTGTLINTPTSVAGKYNQALQFNGSNQYITTSVPSAATDNLTMAAWVNWNSTSGYQVIMQNGGSGSSNSGYALQISNTGCGSGTALGVGLPGVTCDVSANATMPSNTWSHVVAVRESGVWKIYLNGSLSGTGNSSTPIAPSGTFAIGAKSDGTLNFNGSIDDVRMYNRALSATEVQQLYNGTLAYHSHNMFASVWEGFMGIMTGIGSSILGILKLI